MRTLLLPSLWLLVAGGQAISFLTKSTFIDWPNIMFKCRLHDVHVLKEYLLRGIILSRLLELFPSKVVAQVTGITQFSIPNTALWKVVLFAVLRPSTSVGRPQPACCSPIPFGANRMIINSKPRPLDIIKKGFLISHPSTSSSEQSFCSFKKRSDQHGWHL